MALDALLILKNRGYDICRCGLQFKISHLGMTKYVSRDELIDLAFNQPTFVI